MTYRPKCTVANATGADGGGSLGGKFRHIFYGVANKFVIVLFTCGQ